MGVCCAAEELEWGSGGWEDCGWVVCCSHREAREGLLSGDPQGAMQALGEENARGS